MIVGQGVGSSRLCAVHMGAYGCVQVHMGVCQARGGE